MTDEKILNMIRQNVEMGIAGIELVEKHCTDKRLSECIESQRQEYKDILVEADMMLSETGGKAEELPAAAKISSQISGRLKTMMDKSDSKIAEMMIQGNTMGITKLTKHLNEYNGQNGRIKHLADKLLKTEEYNVEQMKAFL